MYNFYSGGDIPDRIRQDAHWIKYLQIINPTKGLFEKYKEFSEFNNEKAAIQ